MFDILLVYKWKVKGWYFVDVKVTKQN